MEIGKHSDIGNTRQMNEDFIDFFYNRENILLALLSDGMGGHQGGEVASQMAVAQLGRRFENSDAKTIPEVKEALEGFIREINVLIYDKSTQYTDLEGMGTTLVGAAFIEETLVVFNVGDSRAYLLKEELELVTSDHSFVNSLLRDGKITKEEAEHHPKRNVLISALGTTEELLIDFYERSFSSESVLLLSSDGLHGVLSEDILKEILSQKISAQEKANLLVEESLQAKSNDNISACVVQNGKEGE